MLEMEIIEPNMIEMEILGQTPNTIGGTTNYNELFNKPKINGIELKGDKSLDEFNIASNESDPTVPNHVKNITQEDINRWNTSTGGGSSNIYSANEEIIGTYFGKPLYRKVVTDIVIQKSTVYNETMIITILNIDKMVRMYGTVDYSNGCHQIGAYGNANFYSLLQYTKQFNTVYFYGANNYIGQKATVIMEYTKTTD